MLMRPVVEGITSKKMLHWMDELLQARFTFIWKEYENEFQGTTNIYA